MFNVTQYYDRVGYEIDRDDIDSGSLRSFFLSASSYQLGLQIVRMFAGMSTYFRPWAPYGIELPNTSFYLTSSGLSYKIRSGFRFGDWRFPGAVEFVYSGDPRTEVTLGAERSHRGVFASAGATIGKAVEPWLDLKYRVHRNVKLSAGYAYYSHKNLNGERMAPSLENRSDFHEVYAGVAVVY